jgi:hypothetical protein
VFEEVHQFGAAERLRKTQSIRHVVDGDPAVCAHQPCGLLHEDADGPAAISLFGLVFSHRPNSSRWP